MTDTLREKVKAYIDYVGTFGDTERETVLLKGLEAALSEPEEPKVERIVILKNWSRDPYRTPMLAMDPPETGVWDLVAERTTLPVKSKAEELAEKVDALAPLLDASYPLSYQEAKEVAAELRRKT